MSRRRAGGVLVVALAFGAAGALATPARAEPSLSVWARARDPGIDERAELIAEAEVVLERHRQMLDEQRIKQTLRPEQAAAIGALRLREARALYERAGADTTRDGVLRLRYAAILSDLGDHAASAASIEDLLRGDPPAPVQADAWRSVAISYARMGRHRDEIKAYRHALALEPHSGPRAVLLANRAEAHMALGELALAVEGYRAALGSLGMIEMFRYGVTTLWGLSVALDRSGDLGSALEHIQLARSYDRTDAQLHGPGWFYVPAYDVHWYAALGHWEAARSAELGAARAELYGQAVTSWERYIEAAPADGQWAPLARARLAQCEQERDDVARRARKARRGAEPRGARGPR